MELFKISIESFMVINQFHAIGDILFLEPMFRHFWKKNGEKPIVPVRDHLMWIAEYIDSADFRPMSKFQLDYDSTATDNPDYFPARFANQILRGYDKNDHHDFENMMLDKYRLAGLPEDLWTTIQINFNVTKGRQLMKDLNLYEGKNFKRYFLYNTQCQAGSIAIPLANVDKNKPMPVWHVAMREIPGYNVLDWFLVMYHAEQNHHVSTSTFFILQAIMNPQRSAGFRNLSIYIYPRPNEDGLRGISQLKPTFKYTPVHD